MNTICVPLYITYPRKTMKDKIISLTMNWYRNSHYVISNNIKRIFKQRLEWELKWKILETPIWISYVLYYKRTSDLMNWWAIIDKFFQDALVQYWCIKDDNVHYIIECHFVVWWNDKENPRMEITIL